MEETRSIREDDPSHSGSMVGSPEDKESGPDSVMKVKVESEFVDDSFPPYEDSVVKVKVESDVVDDSFPPYEDHVVKVKIKSEIVYESSSQDKVKAGGMQIEQKHPPDDEVVAEKESKDVQVLSSAPKMSIVVSGALPQGHREFESAMQAVHNKPMPTVEKFPTARHTSQVIHQPRK